MEEPAFGGMNALSSKILLAVCYKISVIEAFFKFN